MKYKAALFDLDDTLIRSRRLYDKALRYSSAFLASKYSLDVEEFFQLALEKYSLVSKNFPSVHTRHSRILLFRLALDEAVGKYDVSLLPEAEDMFWNYFISNISLFPGVEETLSKLKISGVKIAIVSDGSLALRIRKVKAAGLLQYCDEVIASEEVIFEKPFSAIFTLTLSKLDVDGSDAVMIGNNLKNDIRGAQLVGIRAGLFEPPVEANVEEKDPTIIPDFVITEMPQLLEEFGLKK